MMGVKALHCGQGEERERDSEAIDWGDEMRERGLSDAREGAFQCLRPTEAPRFQALGTGLESLTRLTGGVDESGQRMKTGQGWSMDSIDSGEGVYAHHR